MATNPVKQSGVMQNKRAELCMTSGKKAAKGGGTSGGPCPETASGKGQAHQHVSGK